MGSLREQEIQYARNSAGVSLDEAYALVRGIHSMDGMPAPDEFVRDFFEIVESHRRQFSTPDYNELVGRLIDELDAALASIKKSIEVLPTLSRAHRNTVWHLIGRIQGINDESDAKTHVQLKIGRDPSVAMSHLHDLSGALRIATGQRILHAERGRRELPYVNIAFEFILCWEQWIPRNADSGLGTLRHQALSEAKTIESNWIEGGRANTAIIPNQSAARFVQLGLQLIDPNITGQQVVTSYNNARDLILTLAEQGGPASKFSSLFTAD